MKDLILALEALPKKWRNTIVGAVVVVVILIITSLFTDAEASGLNQNHDHNINLTVTQEYEPQDVDPLSIANDHQDSGVSDSELDKTRAMVAAGDTCVFDYASGWQGCIGGGFSGDESAINGSLVTRVDQIMIRTNIQADTDFDDYAVGVGGSWHF